MAGPPPPSPIMDQLACVPLAEAASLAAKFELWGRLAGDLAQHEAALLAKSTVRASK